MTKYFNIGIICLPLCVVSKISSQPVAVTVYDTAPFIDNVADGLSIPLLRIGEVDFDSTSSFTFNALTKGALWMELPSLPGGTRLESATLRVFLQHAPLVDSHPGFGPLQLDHSRSQNSIYDTQIYSGPDFMRVGTILQPADPAERFYEINVTAQVAADYAFDGTTAYSMFRFQVDGLQYVEDNVSHYYQLMQSGLSFGSPELNLTFAPIPEPTTITLLVSCGFAVLALRRIANRNRKTRHRIEP